MKRRFKVKSLGVFGSYSNGQQTEDSDLDVLVEFHDAPSLLKFIALENHLSDLLGVKVDLVMRDSLKPAIGRRVLSEPLVWVSGPSSGKLKKEPTWL